VLGVLAWDYFHIPPVDHLSDLHSDGLVLLAASAAAIFISTMVDRARSVEERRRQESLARVRMVEAADKERSRVVRDLHDGAQQRLVRTILVLELARISLKDNGSEAGELVEEARQEAQQANDRATRAGTRHPSFRAEQRPGCRRR
jgi:signal transduction histidine kinase